MKKQTRFILILILALVVVVFALLNVAPTIISFGFTKVKLPLIVVLILTLLIGALIALLLSTTSSFSSRRQKKALDQELNVLKQNQQAEIDQAVADAQDKLQKEIIDKTAEISKLKADLKTAQAAAKRTPAPTAPSSSTTSQN